MNAPRFLSQNHHQGSFPAIHPSCQRRWKAPGAPPCWRRSCGRRRCPDAEEQEPAEVEEEQRERRRDQQQREHRSQAGERQQARDRARREPRGRRAARHGAVQHREDEQPEREAVQSRALRQQVRVIEVEPAEIVGLLESAIPHVVAEEPYGIVALERPRRGPPPAQSTSHEEQDHGERRRVPSSAQAAREGEQREGHQDREREALERQRGERIHAQPHHRRGSDRGEVVIGVRQTRITRGNRREIVAEREARHVAQVERPVSPQIGVPGPQSPIVERPGARPQERPAHRQQHDHHEREARPAASGRPSLAAAGNRAPRAQTERHRDQGRRDAHAQHHRERETSAPRDGEHRQRSDDDPEHRAIGQALEWFEPRHGSREKGDPGSAERREPQDAERRSDHALSVAAPPGGPRLTRARIRSRVRSPISGRGSTRARAPR